MGYFDDFLASRPPEDQAILARFPDLKASVDKMETGLAAWNDWREKNWDPQNGMTKTEAALKSELATLNARLVSAPARTDPSDLATLRSQISGLEAKLGDAEKKATEAAARSVEGMNYFYRGVSKRLIPHNAEFGENLDAEDLLKFMHEKNINDPDLAYDQMVAPKRAAIAQKRAEELEQKHAADIAAAEQKGYDKRAQEQAMGPQGQMPTDQTGGIAGVTARMEAPAKISDDVKAKIAEAKLGTQELANMGYDLYRSGAFSGA